MKKTKKGLLLALALATSTTLFVACGEKGGYAGGNLSDNIVGVQVTETEWNVAIAATMSATNLTIESRSVDEAVEGSNWERESEVELIKIADGKLYEESTESESWYWMEDGVLDSGTETFMYKGYSYVEEGVYYALEWDSDSNEWTKEEYPLDYVPSFTCEDVMPLSEEMFDFSLYTYNASNGAYVYVYEGMDMEESITIEIKIKDGKIATMKIEEGWEDVGYVDTEKTSMTFTYGDTAIVIPTDIVIAE